MKTVTEWRNRANRKLAELEAAKEAYKQENTALAELLSFRTSLQEAQNLAQAVAQKVQERAHKQIADVVSHSLEAVFDQPYEFKIIFDLKRGKTEARLVFER